MLGLLSLLELEGELLSVPAADCCYSQNGLSLIVSVYDLSMIMAQELGSDLGCTASFSSSYLHYVVFKSLFCFLSLQPWIFVSSTVYCTTFSTKNFFPFIFYFHLQPLCELLMETWIWDLAFFLLQLGKSLYLREPVSLYVKCRWYFCPIVNVRIKWDDVYEKA